MRSWSGASLERTTAASQSLPPRQVLQLLATGRSTREIALGLHLSIKTVETHRALLMARLKIHDLAGLVRYAVRVGLVSAGQGGG